MGNASPQGKARFRDCVLPYMLWLDADIDAAKRRYRESGSEFALDLEKFAYVLSCSQQAAKELFEASLAIPFHAQLCGVVDC